MRDLGFLVQQSASSSVSGATASEASPNSLIYTPASNFGHFSSTSTSVDRWSFASDALDCDSLESAHSPQFAGHDCEQQGASNGLDDPNKPNIPIRRSRLSRKDVKAIVQRDGDSKADSKGPKRNFDSARNSFSLAKKEYQERTSISDALLKKPDRDRMVSLDYNRSTGSSPRLEIRKSSTASCRGGTLPSPGTPTYRHASTKMQKGWGSERVLLHSNADHRHTGAALLPYNNGRMLPSKWEDAERWISSPASGDGIKRSSVPQPQRQPKSKSGPLGPAGAAYHFLYSPAVPMFETVNIRHYMANSPFSGGVISSNGLTIRSHGHHCAFPVWTGPCMTRSASTHGCSEMISQLPSQDSGEKIEGVRDAATSVFCEVSRRDRATQMSPDGRSPSSSPKRRSSFCDSSPSALPVVELHRFQFPKTEVRGVQVDEMITVPGGTKKNKIQVNRKGSDICDDWKREYDSSASAWDVSEAAKSTSKIHREEARITAWENLQKAKAEAAIRKLEMKLEKKQSSSMDKIMNKLKVAQKRAREMRSSVLASQAHEIARDSHKAVSFHRTCQKSSLRGCFTCPAF